MTAFLGTLPPASLAASDLPRFMAQALGRRRRVDLPGLAALLAEEPLPGYPPHLAPTLLAVLEHLITEGADPAALDPQRAERILSHPDLLDRLAGRVPLERERLRPGTPVTDRVRSATDRRLVVLEGDGPQLALVVAVDTVRVPGLGFTALRGPALARPMRAEDAEGLAASWARVEEGFGADPEALAPWQAAFERLTCRRVVDAAGAARRLTDVAPGVRRRLWQTVVGHLRDRECPEPHRPGPRALEAALAPLGLPDETTAATLRLAEAAYASAGDDPAVALGHVPCDAADLDAYAKRVSVPPGDIVRLRAMGAERIERALRHLAAFERGDVEEGPEALGGDDGAWRALRSLRDTLLRPRYRKDLRAVVALDPLTFAESLLARGEDRGAVLSGVEGLAKRASLEAARRAEERRAAMAETARAPSARAPVAPEEPEEPEEPDAEAPALAEGSLAERVAAPRRAPGAPSAATRTPPEPATRRPAARPGSPPEPKRRRLELPPMPSVPPPRPRPRTRPRPPMPSALFRTNAAALQPPSPSASAQVPQRDPVEGPTPTRRELAPPEAPRADDVGPPAPASAPGESTRLEPAPALTAGRDVASRASPPRATRLVTPGQADRYYAEAFRELEVLERDLLHAAARGARPEALELLQTHRDEARRLASALGPSARSGDPAFSGALAKVESVLGYVARIEPLARGEVTPPLESGRPHGEADAASPGDGDATGPGVLGRLGRLLRGRSPRIEDLDDPHEPDDAPSR